MRVFVFLPTQSNKSPGKTATRHLVERSFRNQRVRHIFCKRTPPPSSHKFTCVHWGYNFFCGSQPCSPSREQLYYGLIDWSLEPPFKAFQNSTASQRLDTKFMKKCQNSKKKYVSTRNQVRVLVPKTSNAPIASSACLSLLSFLLASKFFWELDASFRTIAPKHINFGKFLFSWTFCWWWSP